MKDILNDRVSLSWEEPEVDGGATITGYVIEKRDTSKNNWLLAGNCSQSDLRYTVKKLFEGSEYVFRVAAENKIGVGEFAQIKDGVVCKLPYGESLFFIEGFHTVKKNTK